tara:strand:- start:305 stop:1348 length:1044 start_codon:yes stop_codon:yes gene_type:complete
MRTQNKILAEIVVAKGGTVTDPQNRNSLLQDWLSAISYVRRYFVTLDPVLNSYYSLSTPTTYTNNSSDSFDFSFISTGTMIVLGAGSSPEGFFIGFEGGKLLVGNGVNRVVDSLLVNDGKLHTLYWSISSGIFSVNIDGLTRYSATLSATLPKTINDFGRQDGSSSFYFEGILSNKKFTDSSGNTFTFALNQETSNTETAAEGGNSVTYVGIPTTNRGEFTFVDGSWVGNDLAVNGDFDTDSNWTKNSNWSIFNGNAVSDGSSSGLIYQNLSRPPVYQVSVSVSSVSAGGIQFYDGAAYSTSISVTGVSVFNVLNENSSYGFFTLRTNNGVSAEIDNVSVKQILEVA